MPGLDGLQASRVIKRDERLQHIPKIVMVTAFGREEIEAQAEEIGVESYLLKPIDQVVPQHTGGPLWSCQRDDGDPCAGRATPPTTPRESASCWSRTMR